MPTRLARGTRCDRSAGTGSAPPGRPQRHRQVRQTRFHVTQLMASRIVYLVETDQHLLILDDQGTELMKHRWPGPAKYVSSGRPRGRLAKDHLSVTDVLMREVLPMP